VDSKYDRRFEKDGVRMWESGMESLRRSGAR